VRGIIKGLLHQMHMSMYGIQALLQSIYIEIRAYKYRITETDIQLSIESPDGNKFLVVVVLAGN
jgi:hypothetical protein